MIHSCSVLVRGMKISAVPSTMARGSRRETLRVGGTYRTTTAALASCHELHHLLHGWASLGYDLSLPTLASGEKNTKH